MKFVVVARVTTRKGHIGLLVFDNYALALHHMQGQGFVRIERTQPTRWTEMQNLDKGQYATLAEYQVWGAEE